jgi:hypothetical protein
MEHLTFGKKLPVLIAGRKVLTFFAIPLDFLL